MFFFTRLRIRVLFVCTANVCRSPLAEALLRHYLRQKNLSRMVQVASAGTRVAAPGRRADPRMETLARQQGVSLSKIRARPLRAGLVGKVDLILAMDRGHLRDLAALATEEELSAKVALLGRYLVPVGEEPEDILDPYFGNAQCFQTVFTQIDQAVERLSEELHQTCSVPISDS